MTTIEFENLILKYASDIDYKVNAAFEKVKKPTYLSTEDIRSEVIVECWRAFQRWYHPEKSKPRTFMNQCIVTTLQDIIWKSWKEVKAKSIFSTDGEDSFSLDIPCNDVSIVDFELPKSLTNKELEYITIMLTHQVATQRQARELVRTALSLSIEQERGVRSSIWEKLQENKNARM